MKNIHRLANNPDSSPILLQIIYDKGPDKLTKQYLALNPSTPQSVLISLTKSELEIRRVLSQRDFLEENIFEILLEDPKMFTYLAQNETLSESMMISLTGSGLETQKMLSLNQNSSDVVLSILAESDDEIILDNVFNHIHALDRTRQKASDKILQKMFSG